MFGFRRREEQEKIIEVFGQEWWMREDVKLTIDEIASHLTEEEMKMFEEDMEGLLVNFHIRMFDRCFGWRPIYPLDISKDKIKRTVNKCRFLLHIEQRDKEMFLEYVALTLFERDK